MNEEKFNLTLRKFLKSFGIAGQREIEKSVAQAIEDGKLGGTETLKATARLQIDEISLDTTVEGQIDLE
ncbi:MAG: DUF6494 family protein [Gemmatimonadales bacterium]|jgi:hypothetical protein